MKKRLVIPLLSFLFFIVLFQFVQTSAKANQVITPQWTFQTPGEVTAIQPTYDGGFISTNRIQQPDNTYITKIVKVDAKGNQQWYQDFNIGSRYTILRFIQQVADNTYIAAGTYGNNGNSRFLVIKLASDGTEMWRYTKSREVYDSNLQCFQITKDNGCIIAGTRTMYMNIDYQFYIGKLTSEGVLQWYWEQNSDGGTWDCINSIQETSDGGFIASGYGGKNIPGCSYDKNGFNGKNALYGPYIAKFNAKGAPEWQKVIGGIYDSDINLNNAAIEYIRQTPDNGFIGAITVPVDMEVNDTNDSGVYLVKLDPSGNIQWKKHPIVVNQKGLFPLFQLTKDGEYVLADTIQPNSDKLYCYVAKLDSNGEIDQHIIIDYSYGKFKSMLETSDNGFIFVGASSLDKDANPDMYIVKLDSKMELIWQDTYGTDDWDVANNIIPVYGGYVMTGVLGGASGNYPNVAIKFYTP